tara:strand:+ start:8697 stop:9233 length:537 start_codon:yes stop_codon:yes gene_type:complete
MANLGDTKNVFGRSYIFRNPDTALGPSVYALSSKDLVPVDEDDDVEVISGSAVYDVSSPVSAQRGTPLAFTSFGTLIPAIATDLSTAQVVGVALNSTNPGQTVSFTSDADLTFTGIAGITDEGNNNFVVGGKYYLSATNAGNFTLTPDTTTSGNVVIAIATAVSGNRIALEISQPVVI